jgi:hypothetical protein
VSAVLESEDLRAESSALGLDVVTRDYSWEALMPKTLRVYEKALEMRRSGRERH